MNLKGLFADENAVSPVIGVILMVAITVILAAVIGAFVLGIGGSQEQVPQASFEWSTNSSAGAACNASTPLDHAVAVTHKGGDEINQDNVKLGGNSCASGTLTAGNSLHTDTNGGETISLVWESTQSDSTNILSQFDV